VKHPKRAKLRIVDLIHTHIKIQVRIASHHMIYMMVDQPVGDLGGYSRLQNFSERPHHSKRFETSYSGYALASVELFGETSLQRSRF